ncbi:MAG: ribosomal RNA small subunit methyltransferase A [Nitrospirae bacterium]|nr:ribosomal RNA small subunit methyltransferase A [Nitrospirota bacterium]
MREARSAIRPKKSLGQHFLRDREMVGRILRTARIDADDTIVEIGPGEGCLTFPMAEQASSLIAIELDEGLCASLASKGTSYPNLEIVHGDALTFPYETVPSPFKVVANIPYYITTPLLFRLLEHRDRISTMTIMVQKEVAERITAQPGGKDYGVLSITVQFLSSPEIRFVVPRWAFFPPPKVDSAVLFLTPRPQPAVAVRDSRYFREIVKQAFSHRRKVISNALPSSLCSKEEVQKALGKAGIDPKRRPETLSLEEWGLLSDILFEFKEGK